MPKLLNATESTKPCYTMLLQLSELIYLQYLPAQNLDLDGFLKAISLEVLFTSIIAHRIKLVENEQHKVW